MAFLAGGTPWLLPGIGYLQMLGGKDVEPIILTDCPEGRNRAVKAGAKEGISDIGQVSDRTRQ